MSDYGKKRNNGEYIPDDISDANALSKQLKKELMATFRRFGYLEDKKECEIRIKITSGNVAWINISSKEEIK